MNKKKIKLYEVRKDSLVYAISLVENPAIESNFIYLSEDKPKQVFLEADEKHLVYGAVLIPNKPIYRYDTEEYYIQFPSETIEKLAHSYLQNDNIYSFTQQHQTIADGVSIVESWVKTSEYDKSVELGLDVPVGTWLVGAHIENEDIWSGIKSGEMRGFSVESFLNFNEIMLNKQDKEMTETNLETVEVNESFWVKIATIIKEALKSPEVPELEAQVTAAQVVDEMQQEVENPTEETVVTEEVLEEPIVEEVPAEAIEETVVEETEVVEEPIEEEVPIVEEEPVEDLQITIDELNRQIDELNEKLMMLEKENVKLSKQPSAEPVKINGSNGNGGSNFDRMLAILDGSAFRK